MKISRSQEIGIGFTCLLAENFLGIPWDLLCPITGRGKRFDYQGKSNDLDCIFESKGTSSLSNQYSQIDNGINKKQAYHQRGEHFDVELIISAYIGWNHSLPRIILADPDKSSLRELYNLGSEEYYRIKHYCRVLQFIGLPEISYYLNQYSYSLIKQEGFSQFGSINNINLNFIYSIYKDKKNNINQNDLLSYVKINNQEFIGRWFNTWVPPDTKRYINQLRIEKKIFSAEQKNINRKVFQGIREDLLDSLFQIAFKQSHLLSSEEIKSYLKYIDSGVSVFRDGTIMIFA